MATRVNTKFVIALSTAIVLLVGGGAFALWKYSKSAADYERVADKAMADAQAELAKPNPDIELVNSLAKRAYSNYVAAKNEDPTNTAYLYKFIDAHKLVICSDMTEASNELLEIFKGSYSIHTTLGATEQERELPYQVLLDRDRMGLNVNGSLPLGDLRNITIKRLDGYPDDLNALRHKVMVDVQTIRTETKQRELDQMLADLDKAQEAYPDDPRLVLARARFHINNGSRLYQDAGRSFTEPVIREFSLARDELRNAMEMAPRDPYITLQAMTLMRSLYWPEEQTRIAYFREQIRVAKELAAMLEDKASRDKLFTEELDTAVEMIGQLGNGIDGMEIDGRALATALAEAVRQDRRDEPAAYAILGGQYNRADRAEEAVKVLEQGLAIKRRANALTFVRDQEARASLLSQLAEAEMKVALTSGDAALREEHLRKSGEYINAYRIAESMRPRMLEARAYFLAGQLEFVRNRPDQALRSFERADDIYSGRNLDTLLLLARTHARLNNTGSAIRYYEKALEMRPDLPDRIPMAQLLIAQADPDSQRKAEGHINAYLAEHPGHIQATRIKAELLANRGEHQAAAELIASLGESTGPMAIIDAARFKAQAGQTDEAIQMLRDWLMNLPEGEQMNLIGVRVLLSLLPNREQQLAEIDKFAQTGRIDANTAHTLRIVYEGQGQISVEDQLDLLRRQNPSPINLAFGEFMIYMRAGDEAKAEQALQRANAIDPRDVRVIEWRFRLALNKQRWAEADQAIKDMLALDPADRSELAIANGGFMRAMAQAARGSATPSGAERDRLLQEAVLSYQQALNTDRNYIDGWIQLGQVQILQSNFFAAQQSLTQALDRQPNNPLALPLMAQAEIGIGEPTRALSRYEQIMRLQPNNTAVLDQLSSLARQLGTPSRAIRQREAMRNNFPQNTDNRRQLALLYSDDLSYGKALDEIRAVIKDEGQTRANLEVLARVHIGGKNADQAVADVSAYLDQRGEQADVHDYLLMAQTYELAKQYGPAEAAFQRAIELQEPVGPIASLAWGQALQIRGEFARAAAVYEGLFSALPDNDALKLQTAQVYLRVPDPAKAEQIALSLPSSPDREMLLIEAASRTPNQFGLAVQRARDAAKAYPNNMTLRMLLGQLLLAQQERRPEGSRDLTELRRLAEQLVKDYPDRVEAQLLLANVDVMSNNIPGAIARLEKVIESAPSYQAANERLYGILLEQARSQAQTSREQSRALASQALGVMSTLLRSRADNAEYQRAAGDAASLAGRDAEAVGYYQKAFGLSQTPGDLANYVGALLAVNRGVDANAVLDANPAMVNQSLGLRAMRGRTLAAAGQTEPAANLFGNVLAEAAQNPAARNEIVRQIALAFSQTPERALAIIQSKLGQELPIEVDSILASMMMMQKRFSDAAALLEDHHRNPPADARAHFALIMQLALAHQEAGQLNEAKAVYDDGLKLIDSNPGVIPVRDQVRMINNLAYMLADRMKGFESQAVTYAQRALNLLPKTETDENVALIEDTLGWCLYKAGRNDEAITVLQRSIGKYELSANLMHLGQVYLAKNQKNQALLQFDKAKQRAQASGDTEMIREIDRLRQQAL